MRKFEYNLIGKHNKTSEYLYSDSQEAKKLIYNKEKWLKQALKNNINDEKRTIKWIKKIIPNTISNTEYEEVTTTIEKDSYTHSGFIQYLAIAWANEKGIILRPDMFHNQICCEIGKDVIDNPEIYRKLYTNTEKKINLIIFNNSEENIINLFDKELDKYVDKEFKKLFTDIKFKSQPKNYELVKRICFSHSATPFYNYLITFCGFPSISIIDDYDDWLELYKFIVKMKLIIKENNNSKISNYLIKCESHIKEIIEYFYDDIKLKDKLQNIFYVEDDDDECDSGHSTRYNTFGWIRDFYVIKYDEVSKYPARLPYLPYTENNFFGNKYYSIVTGITSSKLTNNILEPQYDEIIMKIKNKNLFDKIKN